MACSRYEYVKKFEDDDRLLPGCWVVVRLDGRNFTNFCKAHDFAKPNDARALAVMNAAAAVVMHSFRDVVFAYGQSDEYSIVFRRETAVFNRRRSKILSCVVSLFTAAYVMHWGRYMGCTLQSTPSFDGRIVLYPTTKYLRDYLAWRQADVHVNNLYNTIFWALVKRGGMSPVDAELKLKGTLAADKNEMLFTQFGINYNDEAPIFRKGSTIIRRTELNGEVDVAQSEASPTIDGTKSNGEVNTARSEAFAGLQVVHDDIIRAAFWEKHAHILGRPDSDPPRIRG